MTNPPVEIAAWLGCAAFIVALINGGFKLRNNMGAAGREQREVTMGFTPASHREFEDHKKHNSEVHNVLFSKIERADEDVTKQMQRVGERLSKVETSLDTNTQFMRAQFGDLSARLDRKIERDNRT